MRSLIWTAAVAIIVTASGSVAGQKPSRPAPAVTIMTERARIHPASNPTSVLERIWSFDANGDNRVSRDELPERMEGLVSRGDRNHDGFLTPDEIVPLIDLQALPSQRPSGINVRRPGTLADVIADLKLPPDTHNRALAIVTGPRRTVHDPANVDFQTEMKDVLSAEDYDNYLAAATRLRKTPRIINAIGGVVSQPPPPPPVP